MILTILGWTLVIWLAQALLMSIWVFFEKDPKFGRFNLGTAVAVLAFSLMMPHLSLSIMFENVVDFFRKIKDNK